MSDFTTRLLSRLGQLAKGGRWKVRFCASTAGLGHVSKMSILIYMSILFRVESPVKSPFQSGPLRGAVRGTWEGL